MINANELRIGNYLTYRTPDDTDVPCKIDAQDIYNIELNYMFNAEIHSPIPLTEEILLKCGFEKIGSAYNTWGLKSKEFSGYLFEIELNKPFYFRVCDLLLNHWDDRPIQYLHRLQNLYFALTGEELTINL